MKLINYLNRLIEYSFYALFLLVPLIFASSPSELFEFPKMWFTFGITILIGTAWMTKMILQKQFRLQRTPLDIPIALFLLSQITSTIFSLDTHVSLWGYYSRFNGGLFSIIAYIFLYYAFVSNLEVKSVMRLLKVTLFAGLLVALWGLPSHFGYDPTCFLFRGSFDTACWTDAFKPTIRIFSTLGQPAWLAAYASILIPIAIALSIKNTNIKALNSKQYQNPNTKNAKRFETLNLENSKLFRIWNLEFGIFLVLALLFYACLTYTDTRGGFIGFWIANLVFWGITLFLSFRAEQSEAEESHSSKSSLKRSLRSPFGSVGMTIRYFLIFNLSFLIFNFFQGIPVSQLSRFTLPELTKQTQSAHTNALTKPAAGELGGTDSGAIRLLVWKGAISAWKAHPLIGTGVETYAFAYYKYKPAAHNLTTEWDFLYNKAHNEYLNYLATTGVFGLGSYLAIIFLFIFVTIKKLLNSKSQFLNSKQNQNPKDKDTKHFENLSFDNSKLFRISDLDIRTLCIALLSAYVSILVSNFFGFSVVIINLYFFLIPAFVFILSGMLDPEKTFGKNFDKSGSDETSRPNRYQWPLLLIVLLASCFLLFELVSYWIADINYANGSSLDKAGNYQEAIKPLQSAYESKPNEPVYSDELSINLGTLASSLYLQKEASTAGQLAQEAIKLSDQTVKYHPNDVVYWKDRVRLFYTLAQGDTIHQKNYFAQALDAIEKAQVLAPNDAKISYNYAVLSGQIDGPQKGVEILENTVKLKPDYRDAYFALGLYYHELAVDNNGNLVDPPMQQKAINAYQYILKNLDPGDKQAKEGLKSWGVINQ